jgi:hypothetical protein
MTPRDRLKQALDEAENEYNRLEAEQLRTLASVYREALKYATGKLKALYDKIPEDALRSKRIAAWQAYRREVAREIKELTGRMIKIESLAIMDQFETAYYMNGWAMETTFGTDLGFVGLNKAAIIEAVKNDYSKVSWLKSQQTEQAKALYDLRTTVASGFTQGSPFKVTASRLQGVIRGVAYEAMRIVRTESHYASEVARDRVMSRAIAAARELGFEASERWRTIIDKRTHPTHKKMNGEKTGKDGLFTFPAGTDHGPLRVEGPGRTGYASEDINCRCTTTMSLDEVPHGFNDSTDEPFGVWRNRKGIK